MTEARDAVGGLRDLLVRIEGLLAPAAGESTAAGEAPPAVAPAAQVPPAAE